MSFIAGSIPPGKSAAVPGQSQGVARALSSPVAGVRVSWARDVNLQAWADVGAKSSTSDPGVGTVFPAKRHAAVPLAYAGRPRR
jgi:hypothetical protein